MTMSTELQKKLSEYAPEPPAGSWEAIAKALDEAPATGFAQLLHQFEATPPADSWQKINALLDGTSQAKVVPISNSRRRIWQYATAAAILVFAITGFLLLGSRSTTPAINDTRAAATQPADTDAKQIPPQNNTASAIQRVENAGDGQVAALTAYHRESRNITNRIRPDLQLGNVLLAANFIPKKAERKETVLKEANLDKYMVYSDNEGNAMKLPKKLFDFITCVKEDLLCKEQMQQLQEKLASTSMNTDFTGVLEILSNLKENQ